MISLDTLARCLVRPGRDVVKVELIPHDVRNKINWVMTGRADQPFITRNNQFYREGMTMQCMHTIHLDTGVTLNLHDRDCDLIRAGQKFRVMVEEVV